MAGGQHPPPSPPTRPPQQSTLPTRLLQGEPNFSTTDKKENKIVLIYKEIQMGSGAKSFMRKGFLIYV